MEIKHYVKIFDDEGNPTRHEVKVRSFNDGTFKKVHNDEPHFTFFSRFSNTVTVDDKFRLYLISDDLFENDYFLTSEDIEDFGDLEQENAYGQLGALCGINLSKNPVVPTEEELRIRYTRAYLENATGTIVSQSDLTSVGLNSKNIQNFIDSFKLVKANNKHLSFDEIVEILFSECYDDATVDIYMKLASLIKRTQNNAELSSEDVQLSFDLFGNIIDNPSANQKQ